MQIKRKWVAAAAGAAILSTLAYCNRHSLVDIIKADNAISTIREYEEQHGSAYDTFQNIRIGTRPLNNENIDTAAYLTSSLERVPNVPGFLGEYLQNQVAAYGQAQGTILVNLEDQNQGHNHSYALNFDDNKPINLITVCATKQTLTQNLPESHIYAAHVIAHELTHFDIRQRCYPARHAGNDERLAQLVDMAYLLNTPDPLGRWFATQVIPTASNEYMREVFSGWNKISFDDPQKQRYATLAATLAEAALVQSYLQTDHVDLAMSVLDHPQAHLRQEIPYFANMQRHSVDSEQERHLVIALIEDILQSYQDNNKVKEFLKK